VDGSSIVEERRFRAASDGSNRGFSLGAVPPQQGLKPIFHFIPTLPLGAAVPRGRKPPRRVQSVGSEELEIKVRVPGNLS